MRFAIAACLPLMLALAGGCSDSTRPPTLPGPETPDRVVRVPGEYETIQAAIDVADPGDTVLVADGLYTGPGNRDLTFAGKTLVLRSENGPLRTVIDCEGDSTDFHGGFIFEDRGNTSVIEGFTVRGAYTNHGGALYCQGASPTMIDCILTDNYATDSGGAVRCKASAPRFVRCTLAGNGSMAGGGLFAIANASPVLEQCIIALSTGGGAVFASDSGSQPQLTCCVIWGNDGGDWTDEIAEQLGLEGNQQIDPRFCDPVGGDFQLEPGSPCAQEHSACGARIGAVGVGCP